jgi:hypothetical protein
MMSGASEHPKPLACTFANEYGVSADELAGRPRHMLTQQWVEESPDFTEQGDC